MAGYLLRSVKDSARKTALTECVLVEREGKVMSLQNQHLACAASRQTPRGQSRNRILPMQVGTNCKFQNRDCVQIDHVVFDFRC